MTSVAAVIVDVVGSRRLTDRAHAQDAVREAFAVADAVVPALTPLWATFADEFQAVYASPEHACAATGIARLALADAYDIRAGIGFGASVEVEPGATGPVLDGDAWWSARAAIDEAHTRGRRVGTTRTWLVSRMHAHRAAALNNALLLRDQIIGTMNAREKRVTLGLIAGQTQTQIAEAEGVTQSAVSQAARRSGALVLEQTTALWAAS